MSAERGFSRRLAPFDTERDGFVLGEMGVGLWLEPGGSTPSRYGQILGTASAGAAVPLNAWPARPEALERTMRLALDDAELTPGDVDVVYASANATRALDEAEASALRTLFPGSRTVVTSVKGALGESGTSGAAACAAALLCGRNGRVPPIAGLVDADPAAAGLALARKAVPAPGPIVLVNSFASGGALFSVVLRVAAQERGMGERHG
jgi:3-oxoacyl-(acyl-carrier-protein) synthase